MVDVGDKPDTERVAVACGQITMQPETLALIQAGGVKKGDVLTVAQIAGIQAAKRTHELIPMCHPLLLTHIAVELTPASARRAGVDRHPGYRADHGQDRRRDGSADRRSRSRADGL